MNSNRCQDTSIGDLSVYLYYFKFFSKIHLSGYFLNLKKKILSL